jgi:predicted transcriptional regulator
MRGFGEFEAVVMDRAWNHDGPVTVRDLFDELCRARLIAYTTVMSTMDNLHRKGWLAWGVGRQGLPSGILVLLPVMLAALARA